MFTANDVNDSAVSEELTALVDEYNNALASNNVVKLGEFFWQSNLALRFGISEELYGADAINQFRQNRVINFTERKVINQQIVTLGKDLGIATVEFSVMVAGKKKHGRQSQVWVRFENDGWRIVSAHVSHRIETGNTQVADSAVNFADAAAGYLPLGFDERCREGLVGSLAAMAAVAEPLMEFQLPETCEPAPEFKP